MLLSRMLFVDGIRSGALERITFSLRYQGQERSLGCFYQLQGRNEPYYRGHGRIYSLHGRDSECTFICRVQVPDSHVQSFYIAFLFDS